MDREQLISGAIVLAEFGLSKPHDRPGCALVARAACPGLKWSRGRVNGSVSSWNEGFFATALKLPVPVQSSDSAASARLLSASCGAALGACRLARQREPVRKDGLWGAPTRKVRGGRPTPLPNTRRQSWAVPTRQRRIVFECKERRFGTIGWGAGARKLWPPAA